MIFQSTHPTVRVIDRDVGWDSSGQLREISLPSQRERDESGTNEPSIQESRDARAADGSSSTQQQTLRAALEGG